MITLNGVAISNYYNKVKLTLLEKGIAFQEARTAPSQDEALLKRSPLGKIPFIETEHGALSESQAIVDYLEATYPAPPLYPAEAFDRAKCRELIFHIELNVEAVARRLYAQAFFGGSVSAETQDDVRMKLEKGLKGLARIVAFAPYVFADRLTLADCAAWPHFTLVGQATLKVYGEDFVSAQLPGVTDYLALMEARPHVQKVAADRALALEAFYASRKA